MTTSKLLPLTEKQALALDALLARPDAATNRFPLAALDGHDRRSWANLFRIGYLAKDGNDHMKIIATDFIPLDETPTPAEIAAMEDAEPVRKPRKKAPAKPRKK